MSRTPAAAIARLKNLYPGWVIERHPDGWIARARAPRPEWPPWMSGLSTVAPTPALLEIDLMQFAGREGVIVRCRT